MNKLIIFIVLSSFSWLDALAQDTEYRDVHDIPEIQAGIQDRSREIRSIRASFEQLKHLSILENDIKSEGIFYFKRENKLRWEYEKPFRYAIVISGDKIRIRNEGKVSAFDAGSNKLFSEISNLMTVLLRGEIFDNQSFSVKLKENEKYYLAILSPSSNELKQFLNVVYMYFDKAELTVSKLKMMELSGDYTLIEFYNKEINVEIPDHIFNTL